MQCDSRRAGAAALYGLKLQVSPAARNSYRDFQQRSQQDIPPQRIAFRRRQARTRPAAPVAAAAPDAQQSLPARRRKAVKVASRMRAALPAGRMTSNHGRPAAVRPSRTSKLRRPVEQRREPVLHDDDGGARRAAAVKVALLSRTSQGQAGRQMRRACRCCWSGARPAARDQRPERRQHRSCARSRGTETLGPQNQPVGQRAGMALVVIVQEGAAHRRDIPT